MISTPACPSSPNANLGKRWFFYDAALRLVEHELPTGDSETASYNIVTLPDEQTIQTTYAGSAVTAIDHVNRKIKRETDGLGRLIKVTEQDSTGVLAQETSYSYNLLDKLKIKNCG